MTRILGWICACQFYLFLSAKHQVLHSLFFKLLSQVFIQGCFLLRMFPWQSFIHSQSNVINIECIIHTFCFILCFIVLILNGILSVALKWCWNQNALITSCGLSVCLPRWDHLWRQSDGCLGPTLPQDNPQRRLLSANPAAWLHLLLLRYFQSQAVFVCECTQKAICLSACSYNHIFSLDTWFSRLCV